MKHLKKAEQKCSETVVYRYFIGAVMKLLEVIKKACKAIISYITELLMAISLIGMVVAYDAFGSGAINYTTAILFFAILAVLIVSLIKIKILEVKKK